MSKFRRRHNLHSLKKICHYFTHEKEPRTNDRRHSSLLLLAIARSFQKWDICSWKITDHKDTVLIKSSKTDLRSNVRAWTWDEKHSMWESEGTIGAITDVDRATHSLKHYSGKCKHSFILLLKIFSSAILK